MKKICYWAWLSLLIVIISYNGYYLIINFLNAETYINSITYGNIELEMQSYINKKINAAYPKEEIKDIQKITVSDGFPTGKYNIIIYYIDAEDNQNTISFLETDRHGGEIPITKYIRNNGEKIYLHKIEYNTVCIITIILITLIAITAILNIKYRWSK